MPPKRIRNHPLNTDPHGGANHYIRKYTLEPIKWGGSTVGHRPYPGSPGGFEQNEFYYVSPLMLPAPWWRPLNGNEREALAALYPSVGLKF